MAGKRKNAESAREAETVDIVASTLQLAAQQGWRHTSYADIAATSGLPLADLLKRYPTRQSILAELSRRADAAMVAAVEADGGESVRERLFAVIMARFDALQPHRDGLRRVIADSRLDPCAVLAAGRTLERSFGWMLELAGVPAYGLMGLVRRKALALAYADVVRVWLADDSADLGNTMAALDRRLAQLEGFAKRFSGNPLPSLDGASPTA
jgi:AcrR family transcriptional regulator